MLTRFYVLVGFLLLFTYVVDSVSATDQEIEGHVTRKRKGRRYSSLFSIHKIWPVARGSPSDGSCKVWSSSPRTIFKVRLVCLSSVLCCQILMRLKLPRPWTHDHLLFLNWILQEVHFPCEACPHHEIMNWLIHKVDPLAWRGDGDKNYWKAHVQLAFIHLVGYSTEHLKWLYDA